MEKIDTAPSSGATSQPVRPTRPARPRPPARPRGPEHENFPVASRLIAAPLRAPVRAFYAVVRAADEAADAPGLEPAQRRARLDAIEAGLRGEAEGDPRALTLRSSLAAIGHPGLERHAADMLRAFRADLTLEHCDSWEALRDYCRASAEPVGRFLLDLHDEAEADRASADALCTALQLLNHLQDLREDKRELNRIYLPADWMRGAGATPRDLAAEQASRPLRRAIDRALETSEALLAQAAQLPPTLRSRRLRAETVVILSLARALHRRLRDEDPLATRVAPSRADRARAIGRGLAALVLPAPRR